MATEFDFIIVGGGTAGLVLAARLSEDPHVQVLVAEAGEDLRADLRVNVPAMWPQLQGTDADWQLKTVAQEALGNRELVFPQGHLLGGSAALNGMNFVPPAREELDGWAALGNPGWDWEGFSKYFKKTYTLTTGSKTENDGVLQVNIPEEETKWPQVFRDTFGGLGFAAHNDPFSGDIHGAVTYPDAIHPVTKTRSFSGNAYLTPAESRPNLTVWTGVLVDKILFDQASPDGAVATGVQYTTKDGKTQTIPARKEVILSAGTFYSPRVLEQSGIGDAERLQRLGIRVVVNNPFVGENLQTHPMCVIAFETVDDGADGFETIDPIARQNPAALGAAMEAYTSKQRGPFSQTNSNVMAHIPFPGIHTDSGKQDLEQILKSSAGTALSGVKITPDFTEAHEALVRSVLTSPTGASGYYLHFPGWAFYGPTGALVPIPADGHERYFTIAVLLTHPLSRGSSHLTSTPEGELRLAIDPSLLSHPLDAEVLARHVRFLESTLATAAPLAGRLKGHAAPPGWPRGFSADLDDARRFVRENAVAAMHYAGTCSMMPREKGGVVDSCLRVYGASNVRVVDASVMPFVTRANPMATVYGIAEKAADIIKAGL
ncbi:L-sorbose 1-dehydrogenase [Madurella mycetomatis]|uniref:L-sorbose 1-dehydrogenase n=1 Tax=Madurella mycetomatis TaxID=100816 RepID=A0A175VYJ2_9PEZI|nr:L-sorbose 1-dehydrogenase [Madurella mycetomatis]KXX76038.1 L-sorbose 1-dehydrogenase [Madurella mycetomatis]